MKQEEYIEKRKRWAELEEEIVHRIAEIGDQVLMDLFLNWQNLRAELNENSVQMMEELLGKAKEECIVINGKKNECTNCKTINIVPETDKMIAGYCTKCEHPLWNEEEDISIKFQLKHKMCITCKYNSHIKVVNPCCYCIKKSRYEKKENI
jgi:hypothetical protein